MQKYDILNKNIDPNLEKWTQSKKLQKISSGTLFLVSEHRGFSLVEFIQNYHWQIHTRPHISFVLQYIFLW